MNYLKKKMMKNLLKIEDGNVKFFGKIDYIMFPAVGMADFLQKINQDMGEDYLFDLGYEAGMSGASEMVEKLGLLNNSVFINKRVILSMFETLGFGKIDIKVIKPEQCLITLVDNPVIDVGIKKHGKESRVCAHYRGIFSIHAEKELKVKGCKFSETQCRAHGDKMCEWSYNYFKK